MVLLVTGCAPVLSDRSIREANLTIPFRELQRNPDAYKGKVAILGGKIIAATVKKDETWVEVLQQPLDRWYKPRDTDVSHGRFIVVLKGFADPAVYAPGRLITVSGEVMGKEILPIKEVRYTYPVISSREHVLMRRGDDYGRQGQFSFGVGVGFSTR